MVRAAERNAAICKDYVDGMSFYELEQKYQLSRQWLNKILEQGKVELRPRKKLGTFLGVNVHKETKRAVTRLAKKRSTSVSALTNQALQEMLKKGESA